MILSINFQDIKNKLSHISFKHVKIIDMAARVKKANSIRLNNKSKRSTMHTFKNKFLDLVNKKKIEDAKSLFPQIQSMIFKLQKKNILKFNNARRKVSKLAKKLSI